MNLYRKDYEQYLNDMERCARPNDSGFMAHINLTESNEMTIYKESELKDALNLALNTIFKRFNPPAEDVISILGSALIGIIENNVEIQDRRILVKNLCKGIKDNVTTLNGN